MMGSLNNIHRVQGFISHELSAELIDFANTNSRLSGNGITSRAITQFETDMPHHREINSYKQRVEKIIEHEFGFTVSDMFGTSIRKWYPGEEQPPHADCEAKFLLDGDKWEILPINNFSSLFIEYAAITYLNDDYEGGEIYFPEYGLDIKPRPRELIFFPGTQLYTHGVRTITAGNRYTVMTFFTTPKLKYIWNKFVLNPSPLGFIEQTQENAMSVQNTFSRSSIPSMMKIFGQEFE